MPEDVKEKKEMANTFKEISEDKEGESAEDKERREQSQKALYTYHSDLGTKLQQEWQMAEGEKIYTERRHIRDLRQYRGQYDPEIINKIHPNRSKAFLRLTRNKVKTLDARMIDTQFPANEDKNWIIAPTVVPELNPQILEQVAAQMMDASGKVPTEDEMNEVIFKIADKSSKAMEKEINDQLQEFNYRDTIRSVLHSGHVYGTGVLKGPVVKQITIKRWAEVDGEWKQIKIKRIVPVAQFVSVWDIYPDMSAKKMEDARYIWQKHLFTKNNFSRLAARDDFNGEAIKAIIDVHPEGNANYKHYEESLREMSSNSESDGEDAPPKREKYEVHERWGFISIEDAKSLLPDEPEETWDKFEDPELAANVWLVDNIVIKAVLSPIEGSTLPYYFYYYDKDETSIFGDGVPSVMRDPQALYNASVRAMLDNAAISAGPIIEANVDLLADGEDPLELFPFRVFQRIGTGIEAGQQAIRVTKLPSYTKEFMELSNFFKETADESTTVPRSFDKAQSGAQQTATGMSMMLGAQNITLKDQVQFFDDGITRPFIRSMYFWNMEFNPKKNIKGDFNIVARGSKSLIAKEVKMEQINQFLSLTNNELDAQYIKRDVLLRELADIFDLDRLGFIRNESEVAANQQRTQEAEKQQSDQELLLEAMKAESSGHAPNAVDRTIQMFNIALPGNTQQPGMQEGSIQA